MSATIYRGPLTDALLTQLALINKPIGDGSRPKAGGWQGQPNAPGSSYVPYLVLTAGTSTRGSGPISSPQTEWQINYLVATYGVSRTQCDWMADRARDQLAALRTTTVVLGPRSYRVQQIWTQSIGGITPSYETDPPIWAQQDQLVVWLSEEIS